MKKAIPLDINGCVIGHVKKFTDEQWEIMVYTYGKKLRWKLVEKEVEPEPFEEEKIWDDTVKATSDFTGNDLTKRELIKKHGLPEELMKSTRLEIIEIIKSSELYK